MKRLITNDEEMKRADGRVCVCVRRLSTAIAKPRDDEDGRVPVRVESKAGEAAATTPN